MKQFQPTPKALPVLKVALLGCGVVGLAQRDGGVVVSGEDTPPHSNSVDLVPRQDHLTLKDGGDGSARFVGDRSRGRSSHSR